MARIRTIKPEFWAHEELSALPEPTHMLAAALLNYADDHGYFNANPGLVKAACSPLREPSVDIRDSLASLARVGYVVFGKGVDGKTYGRITKFSTHQKVDHPGKSRFDVESITWNELSKPSRQSRETLAPEQGTGNREQGKEQGLKTCAEPQSVSTPVFHEEQQGAAEPSRTVVSIPVLGGEVKVTAEQIADWTASYPAVDVAQQLREMREWVLSNPTRRKTPRGVRKFITGWLAKEQDRGGVRVGPDPRIDADRKARIIEAMDVSDMEGADVAH